MGREMQQEYRARPIAALVALVIGAVGVGWLFPGGFGGSDPVHVTGGASASVYRSVNEAVLDGPGWLASVFELATEGTLIVLGLLMLWVFWTGFRAQDARRTAGSVLVGVGTVTAYAVSEIVKVFASEERPCRALKGVEAIVDCPGPADWSFPSNHSTLAMGMALGLVLVRPRLAAVALPLGVAGGVLRVLVGAHYPHDVVAGVLLGGSVSAAVVLLFGPLAARAATQLWPGRRRRGDASDAARGASAPGASVPQPAPALAEEDQHTLALNVTPQDPARGAHPGHAAQQGQHAGYPGGPYPGQHATAPGQHAGQYPGQYSQHPGQEYGQQYGQQYGQHPAPRPSAPDPRAAGYEGGFVGHDGHGGPAPGAGGGQVREP